MIHKTTQDGKDDIRRALHSPTPRWTSLALFALAVLVLAAGGYGFYRTEKAALQNERFKDLQAIGKLKTGHIADWRKERLGDGRLHAESPLLREAIHGWLNDPKSEGALRDVIQSRMRRLRDIEGYDSIFLISKEGSLLISLETPVHTITAPTQALALQAVAEGAPIFGPIYRCADCGGLHLEVAAPFLDDDGLPVAVLMLRSAPETVLYPLIASWPIPSDTAETVLARRDGDAALLLNPLRHLPDPALTMRIPLTETTAPAVRAVLGHTGTYTGVDYRGEKVMGYIRPVPDSPWFLITKMDTREILWEARYRGILILAIVVLGIFVSAGVTAAVASYHRKNLYKALYKTEQQKLQVQEEIRATLYGIGDGVIATDTSGRVNRMNPAAETLTGWTEAEALGHPLTEVFQIINEDTRATVEDPASRVLREGVVVGLANHTLLISRDGTERPIADSGAPVRNNKGDIMGVALVFSDQSEERAAEKALHESAGVNRAVLDAMGATIAVLDRNGVIVTVNRRWQQFAFDNGDTTNGAAMSLGVNYLEVIRNAKDDSLESAEDALKGIRAVLDGKADEFTLEYPCHSPNEERWFILRATPLGGEAGGAVLAHINITERKHAESEVIRNEKRLQRLVHLLQSDAQTTQAFLDMALEEAIYVTDSRIGYIYFYDDTRQEFILNSWSNSVMQTCTVVNPQSCYELDKTGLWGEAVRQGKPIMVNDYGKANPLKKGCPEGHAVLNTYLTVPIFNEGRVVAVVGVANKTKDYTDKDILQLTLLMDTVWKVVSRHEAQEALRRIEWMLSTSPDAETEDKEHVETAVLDYSVATAQNTCRTILDAVGEDSLREIVNEFLELLGTSASVYEKNGDYALGIIASGWCRLLERASRRLCDTEDEKEALTCGKWLCHESCWAHASSAAMKAGAPTDIACHGGIRIYAVPILANNEIVGVVNIGYGEPPRDDAYLLGLARKFKVASADLHKQAKAYESRPPYIIALAKRRVASAARLIGEIVEHKQAEIEKEHLTAQLLQAQKMESVGRLAGGIAHDYNNMLGVILGRAEIALEQIDAEHPLYNDLDEIHKAAQRSASLTRQLLAFARKQTIQPMVLNLNETVSGMTRMLQRLIGEDIELVWKPGADLWNINIDPSQLDQILANLAVNARDAIVGTGRLVVETDNVVLDEEYCDAHVGFVAGEYAMLAVSDSGEGMDKEILSHVFEPFFTTKVLGKGTGLGLATVYGVVKQNRGFINVYSEPGQGTIFKIYLPRVKASSQELVDNTKMEVSGGTETVLVAEDEEGILLLAQKVLTKLGYTVLAAHNAEEALTMANTWDGDIDLLLTDVVMPGMDGQKLRIQIATERPYLEVIYMSGYTANVIAHHGVVDKDIQFLQKPFTAKVLARKVREVLDA